MIDELFNSDVVVFLLPAVILFVLGLLGLKIFRFGIVFCGFWLGFGMGSIFISDANQTYSLLVSIGIVTSVILGLMAIKLYKPVIFILAFCFSCIGLESVFAGSPLNDIVNLPVANYILIGITTALCSIIIASLALKFFKPLYILLCSWLGMFVAIMITLVSITESSSNGYIWITILTLPLLVLTVITLVLGIISTIKHFKSSRNVIGKFFKIISITIRILLATILSLFTLLLIALMILYGAESCGDGLGLITTICALILSIQTAARQFKLYRDVKI